MLETLLIIVHVVVSIAIIGLVLVQHGKGADAGAAFGSGASQTVFGSRGSGSFLTRATAILATVFFTTSLSLAYLAASDKEEVKSVAGAVAPPVTTLGDVPVLPPSSDVNASDVPVVPGATQSPATEVVPAPVADKASDAASVSSDSATMVGGGESESASVVSDAAPPSEPAPDAKEVVPAADSLPKAVEGGGSSPQ